MESVRVRLDLSYDGTHFHGWAAQPGLRTVEGDLLQALALIARRDVDITVAGRTDAGVHADHQVAHVDMPEDVWKALPGRSSRTPEAALVDRVTSILARSHADFMRAHGLAAPRGYSDIALLDACRVPDTFDARFSAQGRHYVYRLAWRHHSGGDPFSGRRTWTVPAREGLDLAAMAEAAESILGEHDFLSFCKPRAGATTIRTLQELSVVPLRDEGSLSSAEQGARWGVGEGSARPGACEVRVHADAFCHSMVRSLVGALVEIGTGRRPSGWMKALLDACSRTNAAPLAPAHGLTLAGVDYPPPDQWEQRAEQTRAVRSLSCC